MVNPSEKVRNYFKFCKLVPHIFIDSTEGGHERDYETWSYSLTQNSKETDNNLSLHIQITLEFSSLTMQISRSNNSLARFLINLCAIVGGTFVVFGMLNSAVMFARQKLRGT